MQTGENVDLFDLTGKTAIITGANSGIGLGMGIGLAKAGANVAIIGRNKKKNNEALKKFQRLGAKAISITNRCSLPLVSQIGDKEVRKEFG